jgi:hypothetical protein
MLAFVCDYKTLNDTHILINFVTTISDIDDTAGVETEKKPSENEYFGLLSPSAKTHDGSGVDDLIDIRKTQQHFLINNITSRRWRM